MTKNKVNINEILREDYKVPESAFDKKKTKTTLFMLQTIFPTNSLVASEYFVNAFIDDSKFKNDLKHSIFVLFKVEPKNPRWVLFANKVRTKPEFVLEYFAGMQDNRYLIMMVFKVPERYHSEYDLFIEGKYSKFSEEYKKLFPQRTFNDKAQPGESIIWQALHKSEDLRKKLETYFNTEFGPEDELWGKPEPKFEIYRYE